MDVQVRTRVKALVVIDVGSDKKVFYDNNRIGSQLFVALYRFSFPLNHTLDLEYLGEGVSQNVPRTRRNRRGEKTCDYAMICEKILHEGMSNGIFKCSD